MKKIPVLGTQTLNSTTNVKTLIESIDYPVEVLSLIVNNENFDVLLDIKKICDENSNQFIDKIDISFHPTNLGCPPSWNYHFKQYPYADFFIKADDDIEFSSGDLKAMVELIESGENMVFNSKGTKYACFGITKHTLKKVGLFDENFWPCNYEDDDYEIRLRLAGVTESYTNRPIVHRSSGTSLNLSKSETNHDYKLGEFIKQTEEYFYSKWGVSREYQTPFNNPSNKITNIDYKFDYRENKILRCNFSI
jgi:GT2 family glycosyltransferase